MTVSQLPRARLRIVTLMIALTIGVLAALGATGLTAPASAAPAPMVLTYNTAFGGTTLGLPLSGGSVTIDWGDGISNAALTHTYATGGVYTVSISGTATHFGYATDHVVSAGITAVASFGDLGLTDLTRAFYGATHLTSVPAALPPGVTNTSDMFMGASEFNYPIGTWDTSAVTDMNNMFAGASAFNQPIGTWNTAAVRGMSSMFDGARAFNQPIGGWNTALVTDMGHMFQGASRFNQPIGSWNTTAVTGMRYMFQGAVVFNQPIGTWNTAAVRDMSYMFEGVPGYNQSTGRWTSASAFNQPIGAWNTSHITAMTDMFDGAVRFNQPIGAWNTSHVTAMTGMFYGASAFNQPIGTWNTGMVRDLSNMFGGGSGVTTPTHLSTSNYNQLLIGWAARPQIHHVHFGAGSSIYNGAATAAHNTLRLTDGWTIVDGGRTSRRAVPQIIRAPYIGPITYGRTITSASLVDGAANTPGRFFLTRSPLLLSAGVHRLTVIFRPTHTTYYVTTTTILVRVNPRHLTLRLTGLATMAHGHSVMVTVQNTVTGARVTVRWQQGTGRAVARTVIAAGTTARMGLLLPTAGVYQVIASATRPNYVFTGAHGSVTAT